MKTQSTETRNKKLKTVADIQKINTETNNLQPDFETLILKFAKTNYIPESFNFEEFIKIIVTRFNNSLKYSTKTEFINNSTAIIKYTNEKGLISKLNLNQKYALILSKFENTLLSLFLKEEQLKTLQVEKSKFNLKDIAGNSNQTETEQFIENEIFNIINTEQYFCEIVPDNILVQVNETFFNNWFYTQKDKNEILLSALKINEIKKYNKTDFDNKNTQAYFIQTDTQNYVAVFNKYNEIILFEKISEQISISKSLLKSSIISSNITFTSENTNNALFEFAVGNSNTNQTEKIRKTAAYNKFNGKHSAAVSLVKHLAINNYDKIDELALFYLTSIGNPEMPENTIADDYNISELSAKIISSDNFAQIITDFFETWEIPINEKTAFAQLFADLSQTAEQKNIVLPVFEKIADEFNSHSKNVIDKAVMQINLCKFLISCNQNSKADKILKNLLKNQPDDTIFELVPPENIDITDKNSGQILKITILDLLYQTENEAEKEKHLHTAAQIQPLNTERLKKIKNSNSEILKNKSEELLKILDSKFSELNPEAITTTTVLTKNFSEKLLDTTIPHPAIKQNGIYVNIQKWLSKVKPADYSYIKQFSEKLDQNNFKELYTELNIMKNSMGLPQTEFYISRGEKNTGITGYEAEPPFIVIGNEHLQQNTKHSLSKNEIIFSAAAQAAQIKFKHARITSSDIWIAATEKGYFITDTLISLIPAADFIEKSLKNLNKFNELSKILSKTKQIKSAKETIDKALKLSKFFREKFNTDKKNTEQQQLTAASRLMQYTGDRAGLIFCGNITAAVTSILKTNPELWNNNKTDKNLTELFTEKNSLNNLKFQDSAMRISNLFSFYLSDEYENITNKTKK